MRVIKEGWLWAGGALAAGVLAGLLAWPLCGSGWFLGLFLLGVAGAGFMVFFFRDPERTTDPDPNVVLAGADGVIRAVEILPEPRFAAGNAVRISTFLSPLDVHVNRAPVAGTVQEVDYVRGRHLLTLDNRASEHNEHSTILIESDGFQCLVRQIVGPVVRRVVHWLRAGQVLAAGERIGMMKFGSRLDVHLPVDRVEILVRPGQHVSAGLTVIARVRALPSAPETSS